MRIYPGVVLRDDEIQKIHTHAGVSQDVDTMTETTALRECKYPNDKVQVLLDHILQYIAWAERSL